MKLVLKPLYLPINPGIGNCPLGCTSECIVAKKSSLQPPKGATCPLYLHQAQTYDKIFNGIADIIFNTSPTGGGKSLAAYIAGLIKEKYRIVGLYPTIELINDQERQLRKRCEEFESARTKRIDSVYGLKLALRGEPGDRGRKFEHILRSLKRNHFFITNQDIFHLVFHLRYYNPGTALDKLPNALATYPDLFVIDEFAIFGEHQETAIINSLLFIRESRRELSPMRVLFTSATPKASFIEQLKVAGFKVDEVFGEYENEHRQGSNQIIAQEITLEFVSIDDSSLLWLLQKIETIKDILKKENNQGVGLIILNSVALSRQVFNRLNALLKQEIEVREISGQVDEKEREKTRNLLENKAFGKPVLLVATSAVDVGVDYEINLLIFETSDSATFIQRLGRLGRHKGFTSYKAYVLIPSWMRWIWSEINKLEPGKNFDRNEFKTEIVERIFSAKSEFKEYRYYWGHLQAQGMLRALSGNNTHDKSERYRLPLMTEDIHEKITATWRSICKNDFDRKIKRWFCLDEEVRNELLRFRGSSDLQVAVWEIRNGKSCFYIYDLLRLIPYVEIEVIDRKQFVEELAKVNRHEIEFNDQYIQMYIKVVNILEKRRDISLYCDYNREDLTECTLSVTDGFSIVGHPQSRQLNQNLITKSLLTFIVRISDKKDSHWSEVSNKLRLPATFGIYRLKDQDGEHYACAFNQDAMLLEALKWKLNRCKDSKPYLY
ncbi:MAG: type I-D CRISPR-associated helicase Cas3' [Nostoc sp.]